MCLLEDPKVLLIGPGRYSAGKSEVLSLPDLTPLDCNIPVFPGGEYHGYVGRSTSKGVLMCVRKNDVRSPKIESPMSDNFSPTTRYSVCVDVKMMYAPQKLDPPCLTIFCQKLNAIKITGQCQVEEINQSLVT